MTKNFENFINRAKIVHSEYYNYSKVEYINTHEKVCIICPEHGEFWQSPANHLKGSKCKLCSNKARAKSKTKSFESFLNDANLVHSNFYIYEKTNFIKRSDKAIITCPIHGDFEQIINNHLKGEGCSECAKIRSADKRKLTLNEFIIKANNIHNNKYDYSLSVYSKYSDKIKIICPIHGEFEQQVGNHLQGKGCSKCKNDKLAFNRKDSFENFVNKANSVHNKLYDYEKVNYINQLTKIIIICPKHGEFEQTANAHLRGQGCPKCNNSKGEIMIYNWLKNNYSSLKFIEQYRAIWLNGLIYDFYIPSLKIAIEYNGIQHYEPVEFFGGEEYFKYIQNNDRLKDKFSTENGITLIKIKYNNEIIDMKELNNNINAK